MMDRSPSEGKVCPSSNSFSAKCLEYLVSANICPYYENHNEDSSGKYLFTRIIISFRSSVLVYGNRPMRSTLQSKGYYDQKSSVVLFELYMNLHSFHIFPQVNALMLEAYLSICFCKYRINFMTRKCQALHIQCKGNGRHTNASTAHTGYLITTAKTLLSCLTLSPTCLQL